MNNAHAVRVCFLGLGAMGSAMHSRFRTDSQNWIVSAYDPVTCTNPYASPKDAANSAEFCVISVLNDQQTRDALFHPVTGVINADAPPTVVISTSTLAPNAALSIGQQLSQLGIGFIDAPVSGGVSRAASGQLSIFASGPQDSITKAHKVLRTLGTTIDGLIGKEWGLGSRLKCINQCLAGVHIAVAAEALNLAHEGGLDLDMVYETIVKAAGNSWMFEDRGKRMIECLKEEKMSANEVKSAVRIFVKDLEIVVNECERLNVECRLSRDALNVFKKGVALELGMCDDSSVCSVYKQLKSEVVEVYDEPKHELVFRNQFCNALRVRFDPGMKTLTHIHRKNSVYVFLNSTVIRQRVIGDKVTEHVDTVDAGEVRYGVHKEQHLVHSIECVGENPMFCVDVELVQRPVVTSECVLNEKSHELVKERDLVRVYRLALDVGEDVECVYAFCSLIVFQTDAEIEMQCGSYRWNATYVKGDVQWRDPVQRSRQKNIGASRVECYVIELK
uniref:3-hydroxyisobutyrate dehydrogenase n=1 Tax=Timspurckia oligopyrenoides TaxID=708627 RepID=A0A7S1ESR6_9RHOD|mmetsp:Transcript_5771/g.10194  ORF Transcript_5771/g.10194 Transcript_5771/m.10194 type:complete len:503 (+) Transcript_5771:553-2061(+)|eukprot:CAMPEP_0182446024 /NCGR_PEP_ID=MMETSP1172-20130603/3936_1 /TAXON_ID=708627 /ORGANISM="Timspurckia oligopyrenoides, Strain CCMP3278" /LENGTH=502 /DNA_ID=CAMNT_0024641885 /DNA_START=278 /DNA_END=1786 /DNA_ORIENTATION=+